MTSRQGKKTIRVGVIGGGRGRSFALGAPHAGMKLVALCDTWEERLTAIGKQLGVATYADYDTFLAHDMDAVVLANHLGSIRPSKGELYPRPNGYTGGADSTRAFDCRNLRSTIRSASPCRRSCGQSGRSASMWSRTTQHCR